MIKRLVTNLKLLKGLKFKKSFWMTYRSFSLINNDFRFGVLPTYLGRYKTPYHLPFKKCIFNIEKNKRDIIAKWSIDITILGYTIQMQQYKEPFNNPPKATI